MLGALVTLGTSSPNIPTLSDAQHIRSEDGEPVHFVVRISRAAVVRSERFELSLSAISVDDAEVRETFALTSDDAELEVDAQRTVLWLGSIEPLCPGEDDCDLGFELRLDSPSRFDVRVEATMTRAPDSRFLFPENREFPAEATLEIVQE